MTVTHNSAQHRFETAVGGAIAFAEYDRRGDTLVFTHTLTPAPLRGRGLAAKVVKAGLDYARANQFKVTPRCWYVAEYIGKHPEYADLVA